ncbi:MAG: PorV/PorQ family protein [Candidatus Zixiibacteriota bacterium]|nr:MAG: PorV/PorQ family protein [candidate division Zixibacteria bacterium]
MSKAVWRIFTISLTMAVSAAGASRQEMVGARPFGMGGAFIGVADDGNAIYWNPAGMSFLNHHEVSFMHTDLFGTGIMNNYAGYTYPLTEKIALGVDWFNQGFGDDELDFNFNKLNFAASYRFNSRLSAGGLFKYINTRMDLDGRTFADGSGWSGDIAVLYHLNKRYSLGLVSRNLFDAYVNYRGSGYARLYDMSLSVGLAARPKDHLLLALDINDALHVGGEYEYQNSALIRAGIERDLRDEKETRYSFGAGFRINPLQVDYAYTIHPYLDNTSRISASLFFNFGRSVIKIRDIKILAGNGIFPSKYSHYLLNPFISFDLENTGDRPLICDWKVSLDEYLTDAGAEELVLSPHQSRTIYATSQFSDELLKNRTARIGRGLITVTYKEGRETRTAKTGCRILINERGAIQWADKEWIAAFINPKDLTARRFNQELLKAFPAVWEDRSSTRNISRAMLIFDGMQATNMKYLKDPNTIHALHGSDNDVIDYVQYPFELLHSCSGDCDDLTVLFCTLLENVGIRTMVVDIPGHLFMMFDSDIPEYSLISMRVDESLLVTLNGRIYIPLEVTALDRGFMAAWKLGAEEFHRLKDSTLHLIDLREAWKKYPAVEIEADDIEWGGFSEKLTGILAGDMQALTQLNRETELKYHNLLTDMRNDPVVLNCLALEKLSQGDPASAERLLSRAADFAPDNVRLQSNLASVQILNGNYEEGFKRFEQLSVRGRYSPGLLSNILVARCLEIIPYGGDVNETVTAQVRALELDNRLPDIQAGVVTHVFNCLSDKSDDYYETARCIKNTLSTGESYPVSVLKADRPELKGEDIHRELFVWYRITEK